ncbi:MAG: transketolase, partial [Clostridia bacterium]|nr:transketolase [Clostridia bacterium]
AKITGRDYKVYTILGDGESQEGEVWEAAMFASHYKLDNLVAFLDFNKLQIDGDVRNVMDPTPLDEKFRAFGWEVRVTDGHDFEQIDSAVNAGNNGKPLMIICNTVKGKGVSYMENAVGWHGKAPKQPEYEQAVKELDSALQEFAEVE